MPLIIGHLYLIWISPFESTWCTSDFHTIYSRFYLVDFFYLNINFWFLMHRRNWNLQLLGIVLNYFGWLLVVLGGWKGKKKIKIDLNKKKIWFKSNESWFCWFKKKKKLPTLVNCKSSYSWLPCCFPFYGPILENKNKQKNDCEFLFSSHHNTKLQLSDKNIRTHTPLKL